MIRIKHWLLRWLCGPVLFEALERIEAQATYGPFAGGLRAGFGIRYGIHCDCPADEKSTWTKKDGLDLVLVVRHRPGCLKVRS